MKELTCILCPNGCDLAIDMDDRNQILEVRGNLCPRGKQYAQQELIEPKRNIATSVLVQHGDLPLCSVRLTDFIAKEHILEVTDAIHAVRVTAPVEVGQVIISDVCGLGVDVIATRQIHSVKMS